MDDDIGGEVSGPPINPTPTFPKEIPVSSKLLFTTTVAILRIIKPN
jgi:hypothetical protein